MGRPKLLLPFRGRTVLEYSVGAALGSGAGWTVVVLGHEADAARRVLATAYPSHADLLVVTNPDYFTGQASSLRVGLQAAMEAGASGHAGAGPASGEPTSAGSAPALPRAVVFHLGDQPLVTAETIRALIDAYTVASGDTRAATPAGIPAATPAEPQAAPAHPGPLVVAPVHDGRRGNPVLIDRALFPDLLALTGDVGARSLISRYAGDRTLLVPAGPEVLVDLDTPEDYHRLAQRLPPRLEG